MMIIVTGWQVVSRTIQLFFYVSVFSKKKADLRVKFIQNRATILR